MFKGLWIKIKAAIVAAFVLMGFYIKYLLSKNARLEHKAKINDKINDIREDQEIHKEKVLKDEKKNINDKANANNDDFDQFLDGL